MTLKPVSRAAGINAPQPSCEELRELHSQAMEKSKEGKTPTGICAVHIYSPIKSYLFLLLNHIFLLKRTSLWSVQSPFCLLQIHPTFSRMLTKCAPWPLDGQLSLLWEGSTWLTLHSTGFWRFPPPSPWCHLTIELDYEIIDLGQTWV